MFDKLNRNLQTLSSVQGVKSSLEKGVFLVVISSDRSTARGTIAGIKMAFPASRLGVVWIDAHADIHSPYTTLWGICTGGWLQLLWLKII